MKYELDSVTTWQLTLSSTINHTTRNCVSYGSCLLYVPSNVLVTCLARGTQKSLA